MWCCAVCVVFSLTASTSAFYFIFHSTPNMTDPRSHLSPQILTEENLHISTNTGQLSSFKSPEFSHTLLLYGSPTGCTWALAISAKTARTPGKLMSLDPKSIHLRVQSNEKATESSACSASDLFNMRPVSRTRPSDGLTPAVSSFPM